MTSSTLGKCHKCRGDLGLERGNMGTQTDFPETMGRVFTPPLGQFTRPKLIVRLTFAGHYDTFFDPSNLTVKTNATLHVNRELIVIVSRSATHTGFGQIENKTGPGLLLDFLVWVQELFTLSKSCSQITNFDTTGLVQFQRGKESSSAHHESKFTV